MFKFSHNLYFWPEQTHDVQKVVLTNLKVSHQFGQKSLSTLILKLEFLYLKKKPSYLPNLRPYNERSYNWVSVSNDLSFPAQNRDPVTGSNTEIFWPVATRQRSRIRNRDRLSSRSITTQSGLEVQTSIIQWEFLRSTNGGDRIRG